MKTIKIEKITATCTCPGGYNLVVVRVDTSEPGLYGLGCATYTYRYSAVKDVIENYLQPLLIGRDVSRISDIWQMLYVNSYWRSGPIVNNAISGIDMALWDVLGKRASLPLYALLGGKVREAVPVYRYAEKHDLDELSDDVRKLKDSGAKYIRIQRGFTPDLTKAQAVNNAPDGYYVDPIKICLETEEMFDRIRSDFGDEIELCHDIHERIPPDQALYLCKKLEQYRPMFLEDPVAPNQVEWLRQINCQTSVPIAQGELCVNPMEWETIIKDRLITYMRTHISQIGGLTPSLKQAAFCEQFGVRMAYHCPPDGSPIGHAVSMHVDMTLHNFGIQEWPELSDLMYAIFPGTPVVEGSYAYVSDKPGIGVEFDEQLAKEYPAHPIKTVWIEMRNPDGSLQLP